MNSKGLTLHAIDQLYRTSSNDPVLLLLKLSFPIGGDIFLVNNTEDITSNGQLFTAFPFQYVLPTDSDEDEPVITLTISNIGLELMDEFRSNTSGITAQVQAVFASDPNMVELNLDELSLTQASYDEKFIQVILQYNDILNVSVPSYTYSTTDFPGLFNV